LRVLINRTDAIGDTILTMPMAIQIKKKFPDAIITFLVSAKSADMFVNHPYINDCWVYPHSKSPFGKINFLRKKFQEYHPDTYFHVGGSFLPTVFAWWKSLPFRGGLVSKWQSFLFLNKGIRQKRSVVAMHESEYNLELLTGLSDDVSFDYENSSESHIKFIAGEAEQYQNDLKQQLLDQKLPGDRKLIFIHPGMTGHTLNWSPRSYARLMVQMENAFPGEYTYVISFTPSDQVYLKGVEDYLQSTEGASKDLKVFYLDGSKKGLRHYMGCLKGAELFVGPSTGTTHLANLLGVKQVALYSPIKVQSSMRWGPLSKNNKLKIMVPDVVCGEQFQCAGRVCPYHECMSKIEVEDVIKALTELVDNRPSGGAL
jgi:heptosyltransferase III